MIRRSRIAVTAAALIAASGCAGGGAVREAVRENVDGSLTVQCTGGYHDWSRCHQRAADACRPDGFDIVAQLSNEGSTGVGVRDWSVGGSEVARSLVVRCR